MPIAQGATAVTAGATNDNVLANTPAQFVERPSRVRFYVVGEAAGESRCQIEIGARVAMRESPISRQNRVPIVPDDLVIEDIAMPGEHLTVKLRNTGAGTNTVFWRTEVMPLQ